MFPGRRGARRFSGAFYWNVVLNHGCLDGYVGPLAKGRVMRCFLFTFVLCRCFGRYTSWYLRCCVLDHALQLCGCNGLRRWWRHDYWSGMGRVSLSLWRAERQRASVWVGFLEGFGWFFFPDPLRSVCRFICPFAAPSLEDSS